MLLQMALFHSFYSWVIFNIPLYIHTHTHTHTHMPHLIYSFICWWTFRLLPCVGYFKSCCYEQRVHVSFYLLFSPQICPGMGLQDHMVTLVFKETSTVAASIYIPTNWEGSFLSTLSPAFIICRFLNDGHRTSVFL